MLRSSLFTASAFALVAGASAQTPQQLGAEKIIGPIKDAGIYHVATGTWTRTGGQVAALGGDVIYSNIAGSGYFTSAGGAGGFASGSTNYDEGGLPGTTNGNTFGTAPDRDVYRVNGFQIGYCDFGGAMTGGWDISFYESFDSCNLPTVAPDATINLTLLPAAGCWTVTMDLAGGAEFDFGADGGAANPGWDDDEDLDAFGWSYVYTGTSGATAGFFLTGDPKNTDPTFLVGGTPLDGTNTYYGVDSLCGAPNGAPSLSTIGTTGYLTGDRWWLEDPTGTSSNCYFFGGYANQNTGCGVVGTPFASFHMEIYSEDGGCAPFSTTYCSSAPNSTGVNTAMEVCGSQTGADNNATLRAFNMPNNSFGFFITSQTQGMSTGAPGNVGTLCLMGNIGRFIAPGQIKSSGQSGGEITLDSSIGEWSTQSIPLATGQPYAAMAGVTSNFQLWHRDSAGGMVVSNFSDGVQVDWL